jgi:hypothetical protein
LLECSVMFTVISASSTTSGCGSTWVLGVHWGQQLADKKKTVLLASTSISTTLRLAVGGLGSRGGGIFCVDFLSSEIE